MKTFFQIIIVWVICASIFILVFLGVRELFRMATVREYHAMSIQWCFQEGADGTLYHYECKSHE